jgi:manganese/zinc/iron transport system substrate-binding protein
MISRTYSTFLHQIQNFYPLALMGFTLLMGMGCTLQNGGIPNLEGRKARVVCTTGMIADAVEQIAKDRAEVTCLMGPGIDPHRYIATPKDMQLLEKADLILYNGLHLEGKMGDVLEARSRYTRTKAIGEGLSRLRLADEATGGTHDPHIWFDVLLWAEALKNVRDALIEIDPAHAEFYKANYDTYAEELRKLDSEVRQIIQSIPKEKRVLITAHDAFGYFGQAYGIEVHGLQGVSTATDTGSRDVMALADLIGQRKIPCIFAETSVPDAGLQAVIKATKKAYKHDVILAEDRLYSDALGEPGSGGETYIGMVRHNTTTIAKNLKR